MAWDASFCLLTNGCAPFGLGQAVLLCLSKQPRGGISEPVATLKRKGREDLHIYQLTVEILIVGACGRGRKISEAAQRTIGTTDPRHPSRIRRVQRKLSKLVVRQHLCQGPTGNGMPVVAAGFVRRVREPWLWR